MRIFLIAGARPNFMKIAPITRALDAKKNVDYAIVHTGQHYDYAMSQAFFEDLDIPDPLYHLDAGSGTHAVQTARIMTAFEEICVNERPDIVLVVGDVNSTLACSIVAKKMQIKVAHVEAGLRSFDLTMPEEINRMVTDSITDYFFTTEKAAGQNLLNEGKPLDNIHFVGHVMIDNLFYQLNKLQTEDTSAFSVKDVNSGLDHYIFMTLHRPATVDNRENLTEVIGALNVVAEKTPVIFPVHPRTAKMVERFGLELSPNIRQLGPLGFKESLYLWKDASAVFTDSGGLQEETTALGIPCFTLRNNTERPVTINEGTNTLVGTSDTAILAAYNDLANGKIKKGSVPDLWDGKASERIADVLVAQRYD